MSQEESRTKLHLPRAVIAAPKSGSGKTMAACGLMEAFQEAGENVRAFKCGPDYIDPMFHRKVLGVPSENLDSFFMDPEQIQALLGMGGGDLALIEGVMGIYDGIGGTDRQGSAWHIAQITESPVILIMDVRGMGITMISLLKGLLSDDTDRRIRGVICNRITGSFYERMAPQIAALGIEPLGFLPAMREIRLESRHLGLKQPEEIKDLREQVRRIAEALKENVRMDRLRQIMEEAPDLTIPRKKEYRECGTGTRPLLVLAVARDEAFSFYYEANLREFRDRGVVIRTFSPLRDKQVPEDADGLLLGGGYPELWCRELAENEDMRASVRKAIRNGMPSLAECGGFLYLHERLTDTGGSSFPMAGVIPGNSKNTGKLCRFGYIKLQPVNADCREENNCEKNGSAGKETLLRPGETVKGHEFHYYDSDTNGEDCLAVKEGSSVQWKCCQLGKRHLWGFPHLYYPSAPFLTERFIREMETYRKDKS